MKTPKIIFCYSWPYDIHWNEWTKQKFALPEKKVLPETSVAEIIKKIEKKWLPIEEMIEKEISIILNIQWKEKKIPCYIVSNGHGISNPMTVGINQKNLDQIIDTLIHELTHRIFIQEENIKKAQLAWEWIRKEYKEENQITQNHIICHSLVKHLYLAFFNKKRLLKEMEINQKHKDYKRAWEIVERDDFNNILKNFRGCY